MTNMDNSIQKKQLTTLALIGLVILVLFATGFVWLYYYVGVLGNGGVDVFLAFAPYFIFPYLVVISVYVGFFAARFAKGSWKHAWLWGIAGFALTLLFIMGFPILLSPIFPYPSPAIFAFLAPVFSALLIVLLISIRRKATVYRVEHPIGFEGPMNLLPNTAFSERHPINMKNVSLS